MIGITERIFAERIDRTFLATVSDAQGVFRVYRRSRTGSNLGCVMATSSYPELFALMNGQPTAVRR